MITVHIVVTDANGQSSDVRVSDHLRVGDVIPERINVLAAEAASMAHWALHHSGEPIHRDKREPR